MQSLEFHIYTKIPDSANLHASKCQRLRTRTRKNNNNSYAFSDVVLDSLCFSLYIRFFDT